MGSKDEDKIACRFCRYWEGNLVISKATCRRYPPPAYKSSFIGAWSPVWPKTYRNEWCGEFKAKES